MIPKTITAGVDFTAGAWRAEFSSAAWSMVLMLRGPAVVDLTAERDGARHVWSVPASVTQAWTPGEYAYAIRASDGIEVREVESGRVRIRPDIASAVAGFDGRSQNRIALEAIEAVLAKRATLDQERYRINTGNGERELYRTPIEELIRLRNHYARLVGQEDAAQGGRSPYRIRQYKLVMRGPR